MRNVRFRSSVQFGSKGGFGKGIVGAAAVALSLAFAGPAAADDLWDKAKAGEGEVADDFSYPKEGTEKVGHGEINWSTKRVTATGSAAARLNAPSVAVARLEAERAAKLDALRNIIETLQGVRVSGSKSAGDLMSNGTIKSKVQGMAQGFKVVDTRYYSDGSVDIVVQMPIDDDLTSVLLSGTRSKKGKKVSTSGPATHTGLIVNARSLGVAASISPKVFDENGKEVYGPDFVSEEGLAQGGIVGYQKTVDGAKKDARAGKSPLIIKALRKRKGAETDIVISNADADKLRGNTNLSFLKDGKVIIVLDD